MDDHTTSQYKQPGESIDRFQILSVLGAGGMGVVYKAHDPSLNKVVAIKLINGEFASAQLHIRFQQEAKALRDLKHPAIPEIYDFAVSKDQEPFMVIDFIKGKSLYDYLEEKGKLSMQEAFQILEPLCEALKYAHDHSIVHRDIKPDNIILSMDKKTGTIQEVKVIDFGLAHLDEDLTKSQEITKTGNVLGSPKYMSPEQAKGVKATPSSDIYSVGCVLFEMLAGRAPFVGDTPLKVITMHVTKDAEDSFDALPDELLENKELTTLLSKCLAKEPEDRYGEIDDVSRSLRNILAVKNRPIIDVPEIETSNISVKALLKPVLIGVFAIGILSFGIYSLIFSYLKKAPQIEARNYVPESDSAQKIVTKSGFVHAARKGEGYYNGAANITDSDFAGLLTANPAPLNVISDKSDTVTGKGVYYLRNTRLYRLDLVSSSLSDLALKNAGLISSLTDLTVGGTDKLTSDGFKNLNRNKELRILNLENCRLNPGVIDAISQLKDLYSLALKGSKPLGDEDLLTLSKLENLNNLALDFTDVTPGGLSHLAKFKNLRGLKVEFLKIENKNVPVIARLPLRSLDISDNKITADGLRLLAKNKYLKLLDCMNQNWMNDKSIDENTREKMAQEYQKAAREFQKSDPERKIRWNFGPSDPCK